MRFISIDTVDAIKESLVTQAETREWKRRKPGSCPGGRNTGRPDALRLRIPVWGNRSGVRKLQSTTNPH